MSTLEKEIQKALTELRIGQKEDLIECLSIYSNELITWNERFNLTSITKPEEVAVKHVADSLMPAAFDLIKNTGKLADCGTGAGFPGIPLALYFNELMVTLIESNNKKITFLNHIKELLEIENLNIIQGRSEELSHIEAFREKFDFVTMRAFANFPAAMELTSALAKSGGKIIFYASREQAKQIDDNNIIFSEFQIKHHKDLEYELMENMGSRSLVVINKTGNTPKKYPRIYGKIKNNPL